MEPRVIGTYGGPKIDATVVSNPETQVSAGNFNRTFEDLAQATRTVQRAVASFTTTTVAAPTTVVAASVNVRTVWGSAPAQKPVVTKTATGLYTLTWSPTFTDPLSETESVSFFDGHVSCRGADPLDDLDGRIVTIAANVVSIVVKSNEAAADVGNVSMNEFTVSVWLL